MAQPPKVFNLQRFDERKFHFGMGLGVNSAGLSLHRKAYNQQSDSVLHINVTNQSGFNIGIVSSVKLTKYVSLRFIPTYVFSQRLLSYQFKNSKEERVVESTYIDLPLLIKYRSARLNNFACYYVVGGKYVIDFASNENVNNADISESIIKLKKYSTALEAGIGTDFFLQYVKLSVELKMSYGLQDVLIQDETELSAPLEKIVPKMFFLTFLFEG